MRHVAVERARGRRELHHELGVHQPVGVLGLAGVGEAQQVFLLDVHGEDPALHDVEVPRLRVRRRLLGPDQAVVLVVPAQEGVRPGKEDGKGKGRAYLTRYAPVVIRPKKPTFLSSSTRLSPRFDSAQASPLATPHSYVAGSSPSPSGLCME